MISIEETSAATVISMTPFDLTGSEETKVPSSSLFNPFTLKEESTLSFLTMHFIFFGTLIFIEDAPDSTITLTLGCKEPIFKLTDEAFALTTKFSILN